MDWTWTISLLISTSWVTGTIGMSRPYNFFIWTKYRSLWRYYRENLCSLHQSLPVGCILCKRHKQTTTLTLIQSVCSVLCYLVTCRSVWPPLKSDSELFYHCKDQTGRIFSHLHTPTSGNYWFFLLSLQISLSLSLSLCVCVYYEICQSEEFRGGCTILV
jgi:hypothetical protein